MPKPLEKLIEELVEEALDEVNAISAGGGSLQPAGQVSGTGGNPLGRDMSDQYDIMWSGDEPENKKKKLKEGLRPEYKPGKGLKFTRYGGLTPRKQKNTAAPIKKGLWAFIYPHWDWWFLSGGFSDIEGRFKKSGEINKNLLKHFYYEGPVFTKINVPGSSEKNGWYLTTTEELSKHLPKQYSGDLKFSRKEVGHKPQNKAVTRDVYKHGNISIDHYEVFIPGRGFKVQKPNREIDEINALSTGAVVGYTLPLGMKPDHQKMGTKGKKKKRPKRWYDVNRESVNESALQENKQFRIRVKDDNGEQVATATVKFDNGIAFLDSIIVIPGQRGQGIGKQLYKAANIEAKKRFGTALTSSDFLTPHSKKMWKYLSDEGLAKKVGDRYQMEADELDEEYIGKKGGVRYYQMGGSLPDALYNRTDDGKPTRDPGVAGLDRKKKKKK